MRLSKVYWQNVILFKGECSLFERFVAAIVIVLGLLMCGFGPMG